tara:strand:+ start:2329 stop:2886 length:558 start_codon:yes stop_codon:yes gene_type:complete
VYITNNNLQDQVHFIPIDKRVKDPSTNKTYIILDSGERIIMPETIQSVPAVMLLEQGYKVIYGDEIYSLFQPVVKKQIEKTTDFNMEPTSFSFGDGFSSMGTGVMSDSYSFLDMNSDELGTKGQGGMRQMYNYVGLQDPGLGGDIKTPKDDFDYRNSSDGMSLEALQKQREAEFQNMKTNQDQGM